MKKNAWEQHHPLQLLRAVGAKVLVATWLGALWICLAATTGHAMEWQFGMDPHPRRVGRNAWHFRVDLGVRPVGQLQFVGSQYDFAWQTQGVAIAYDSNRRGSGYSDSREFLVIAPTLFDPINGFSNGWDVTDLNDGRFSGVVYATAPPTAVYFLIEADGFVRARRGR